MGVKELWPLLAPVASKKSFDDISGQTVAIDLSIWIVDSQCVKPMMGTVTRPHLRNLFFRTCALLQANVLPVFVVDGKAPELKWETMAERQNQRHGRPTKSNSQKTSARRANRSHFNSIIKECCEMLAYLGIPTITAEGEAEAMCAALNSHGLVDAVITDDGDAFLYGAQTVYRNFTITKIPSVDSYSVTDIEKEVKLTRNHLIALSMLIGCDYCPKGVPGIGKTLAINFCSEVPGEVILKKLDHWSTLGLSGTETSTEKLIASKISNMTANNFSQILTEFSNKSCRVPAEVGAWRKPLISKAQEFYQAKMEWPLNYSLEKMLPLLTLWNFECHSRSETSSLASIQPHKILKKRVRQGVPCLEVEWDVSDPYVTEEDAEPPPLVTIEALATMEKCYPQAVDRFNSTKAAGKVKKGKQPVGDDEWSSQQMGETDSKQVQSNRLPPKLLLPKLQKGSYEAATIPEPMSAIHHTSRVLPEGHNLETTANVLAKCHSDQTTDAPSTFNLNEFQEFSYMEIDNSMGNMLQKNSQEISDNSVNKQAKCDELSINSIDELLADISEQLKTPRQQKLSARKSDNIITDHLRSKERNVQSQLTESSSCETESELSLFALNSSGDFEVCSVPASPLIRHSVQESTPLKKEENHCITFGEFDLAPQFSSLSFSDMSSS